MKKSNRKVCSLISEANVLPIESSQQIVRLTYGTEHFKNLSWTL